MFYSHSQIYYTFISLHICITLQVGVHTTLHIHVLHFHIIMFIHISNTYISFHLYIILQIHVLHKTKEIITAIVSCTELSGFRNE